MFNVALKKCKINNETWIGFEISLTERCFGIFFDTPGYVSAPIGTKESIKTKLKEIINVNTVAYSLPCPEAKSVSDILTDIEDKDAKWFLEKGTFLLDALSDFLERKSNKEKVAIVLTKNPIWDIKKCLELAEKNNIKLAIVRCGSTTEDNEKIIPRKLIKFDRNIMIFEIVDPLPPEILNPSESDLKIVFEDVLWSEMIDASVPKIKKNNQGKKGAEIKITGTYKGYFNLTEKAQDHMRISYYLSGRKVKDVQLRDIQNDNQITEYIKCIKKSESEKWENMGRKLLEAIEKTIEEKGGLEFNCDPCSAQIKERIICDRCGAPHPEFKILKEEFWNDSEKKYKYPEFMIFSFISQSVKKDSLERCADKRIERNGITIEKIEKSGIEFLKISSTNRFKLLFPKQNEQNEYQRLPRGKVYYLYFTENKKVIIIDFAL